MHENIMASSYSAELYRETFSQPELDSKITIGRFSRKVAIVTGGNSGIGRACVERFSNDGATVAIFARNVERGEGVASEIRARGGNVKFYQVDVTDQHRCVEAVKQVAEDNGGMVHFLVNCHRDKSAKSSPGEVTTGSILDTPLETLKHLFDVQVVGSVSLIQACFPFMKKEGNSCAIVNITSTETVSNVALPNVGAIGISNGARSTLTKYAALDLSTSGIRVNSVSPAWTWTPMVAQLLETKDRANEHAKKVHMSRCMIDAAGIASVVAFLCSKDAMYIDGANLAVDCGYSAMGPEGLGQ